MSEGQTYSEAGRRRAQPLTFVQRQILERAVAKIALIGEVAGVSVDEMILLLNSGLTVSELVEYLGVRTRQGIGQPLMDAWDDRPKGD